MATKSIRAGVFFVYILTAVTIVTCFESNEIFGRDRRLKIYWNVPTFQCASHKIFFTDISRKFGIIQNENDTFRGNQITIMYDPGYFPALLKEKGRKYHFRNGGLPQQGNLSLHLEYFQKDLEKQIPDINFNGIGIIDFESWRPIFRQNFGSLIPYKDFSIELERQNHPWWPNTLIQKEATRRFEKAGKSFMEETLIYVKQLRPNATWGYYAYPYCFNMNSNMEKECSSEVKKENDRMSWLFNISDGYYPSLYMAKDTLTNKQKIQMIEGRIAEAKRLSKNTNSFTKPLILPYFWYRYRDVEEYLSKEDMFNSLLTLKSLNVDGVILWGSSKDVSSKIKCQNLKNYIENVLGPMLLKI